MSNEQLERRKQFNLRAIRDGYEILLRMVVGKHADKYQYDESPTLSALNYILHSLEIDGKEKQLSKAEDPIVEFETIIEQNNILWRRVKLKDKWWRYATGVMLAKTNANQFVSLIPAWRGYYLYNSETGRKQKVGKKVIQQINEEAFCFSPSLPQRPIDFNDIVRFLFKSLSLPDWVQVLSLTLMVTLLGLFLPFVTKQLFDEVIPSGNPSGIIPIMILLLGTGISSVLFITLRDILLIRMKDKSNSNLQTALVSRAFRLPTNFFKKYPAGDLSRRIMVLSTLSIVYSNRTICRILTGIFSCIYLIQVFIYGQSLLPICLGILIAQLMFCYLHYIFMSRHIIKVLPHIAQTRGIVYSLLKGIQKIKTSGSELRAFHQWAKYFEKSKYYTAETPVFLKIAPAIPILIGVAGTGLIYFQAMHSHVSISNFFALIMAFAQVTAAMNELIAEVVSTSNIQPDVELAKPVLDAQLESVTSGIQIKSISGGVEMSNLKFRYNSLSPYIFDGLSLKILPGEFVALVGKSGMGKSTLIRLLLGFERPESGTIFYDGFDLEKLNKQSLRRCVGTCLQDGELFPGDIFSNITITAPWSTISDAWTAAKIAAIDSEIKAMPMQMQTLISESGSAGISGGQRQRLLIARAIINRPSLLIMDEATSALDNLKQEQVTKNIEQTHCTRIVIAHRLSTIRHADRIIVLDKGKVAEEGSFEELIEKKGLFYELSKRQM